MKSQHFTIIKDQLWKRLRSDIINYIKFINKLDSSVYQIFYNRPAVKSRTETHNLLKVQLHSILK